MTNNSAISGAAFFIVVWMMILAPNSEQNAVDAMFKCRVLNPQPGALYSCMNYQGFKITEPGQQDVTEVTNYVTMFGWEHGWLKRTLDTLRGWMK
ncbi:hypothetical protein [Mesorhizobium onobrychidis]|uniref:Uncharacterized protein n=1 Tax=Mesorhizobium onobrychidis TaxID=2775404 RepID=A0ABY5R4L8_9HYPH|nr:hypothetical protein [Mesorhizobium onobrychidis]UVC17597.1 hypothetical protein IHQ72_11135 [Mesorhizobium onobrychidis]